VGRQLQAEHKFEYDNVKYGAQLMLWGLFKKLVIADRVAPIVATIFAEGFAYQGYHVFFGVLAYSFQIYGDFSGGTDITRGAAQMMGINLPVNFERPFFATSMADFWHRWHMSLGAWMREYVFYPVMLSKPVTAVSKRFRKRFGAHIGKIVPSVAAPMVVFFLMNIWHGLGAQRVVNAFYNAFIISSTVALTPVYKKLGEKLKVNTECFSFRLFQMARTFALLCVSRIITLAPSLSVAFDMLKAMLRSRIFLTATGLDFMLGGSGEIFTYGVSRRGMIVLLFAVLILLAVGILQETGVKIRETLAKQNLLFRWGIILALMVIVLVFGVYGPGYDPRAFIYGGY
jgi:D-alanyl-lipoteichoic acid acyltransferase DltB (MBOAT superfamily)